MKSPSAYYLLLLYLTVVLKPLLPLAADWWAHTFDETRHIALIHAKYGVNHVQKEIAATGSESDHSKDPNAPQTEDSSGVHLSPAIGGYTFRLHQNPVRYLCYKGSQLPFVLRRIQVPPPRFS